MIQKLNSLLYKSYLKKAGYSIGDPDDFYKITANISSVLYTVSIIQMIKEV